MVYYRFTYILLLSALHFLTGFSFLHFASWPQVGLFERKDAAWRYVMLAAVTGLGSIVLMNYSLRFNSVGSYQILKVAVLPVTVLLTAWQGGKLTREDIGAAALVSVGTAVATVTDMGLTMFGACIGVMAVVVTA